MTVEHGDSVGTHFTCITSTKVQILTQKPLLASRLFAFMSEDTSCSSSSSSSSFSTYGSTSSPTQTSRLEAIEQERDALRAKTESLQKEYDKLWNTVKNMVQIGQAAITRAVWTESARDYCTYLNNFCPFFSTLWSSKAVIIMNFRIFCRCFTIFPIERIALALYADTSIRWLFKYSMNVNTRNQLSAPFECPYIETLFVSTFTLI